MLYLCPLWRLGYWRKRGNLFCKTDHESLQNRPREPSKGFMDMVRQPSDMQQTTIKPEAMNPWSHEAWSHEAMKPEFIMKIWIYWMFYDHLSVHSPLSWLNWVDKDDWWGWLERKARGPSIYQQEACRSDRSAIYNWLSGHRKFTKSQFKHCSKSRIWHLGNHIWSLFAQIHRKSWPKVKSDQIGVCSNIAQNHSSSL